MRNYGEDDLSIRKDDTKYRSEHDANRQRDNTSVQTRTRNQNKKYIH